MRLKFRLRKAIFNLCIFIIYHIVNEPSLIIGSTHTIGYLMEMHKIQVRITLRVRIKRIFIMLKWKVFWLKVAVKKLYTQVFCKNDLDSFGNNKEKHYKQL